MKLGRERECVNLQPVQPCRKTRLAGTGPRRETPMAEVTLYHYPS